MLPEIKEFSSIIDLLKKFPDEQTCIDQLEAIRWGGHVVSPYNAESKVYKCAGNKYKCKETAKYFNVRTGTIFEDTKLPLRTWFLAIYLIASHKKGISSHQLARDLSITQKSAWFVLHRVRYAFNHKDFIAAMSGTVELDETYVGGRASNKHISKRGKTKGRGTGTVDKTPVFGMLERGGNVQAVVVPDAKAITLVPIIHERIKPNTHLITDDWNSYKKVGPLYSHSIVKHTTSQYVTESGAHTNGIEGFWGLFKRGIIGIYHHISREHTQKYVDEFTYRYNTRELSESARFNLLLTNTAGRLTYEQLITHE
jgi:transposase-like protein